MAHNNRAAFISLMGAAFFWSLSGIFIYYLNSSMGPLAQSAARYGSAGIALFIISFIAFRKEMIIREITVLKYIALAGFLGFIFQMFWVYSLYFIKPGTASLLGEFGTLISLILFCIVDKSERSAVKSPAFWLSVIVMLTGATLIIVFNPANQFDLNKGAFLLFICQIFWACYILVVKKILKFRNPVISMAYISTAIALFHLVPAIVTGQAAVYGTLPAKTLIIVILSGVFSIAASHTLFYNAVNKIGVVIANNGLLIQPLIVCLLSYLIFGEKLTPPQMGGGVLLILGAWLTYRAKPAVAKVE